MNRKIFKKWSAVLLTVAIICGLFAVMPISVYADAPAYSSTYSKLLDWSGTVLSSDPYFAGELPVKDTGAETYVSYTVTPNATAISTNGWLSPLIAFANVTYSGNDYALAIRMSGTHGYAVGVYGMDTAQSCEQYVASWHTYPDTGTNTCSSSAYSLTARIEGNSVSIWMGNDCIVNVADMEATYGITVNGACVAAHYNYGSYGYTLTASAWTTNANSHIVYSSDSHVKIQSYASTSLTNGDFATYSTYDVADKAVYNSVTVKTSTQLSGWYGPYILLAEAKKTDDDSTWYLGLRLTGGYGYYLRMFQARDNGNQIDAKYDAKAYPVNGSNTLTTSNISIVSKVADGKASVWLQGKNIALNLEPSGYTITRSVVRTCTMGYGYTLSFDSYIEQEPAPIYNSATSVASTSTAITTATATQIVTYSGAEDVTKNIYTSIDLSIAYNGNANDWSGPYILLAETDYSDGTDATWYLGLRICKGYGYNFRLFSSTAAAGNSGNAEFTGSVSYGYFLNGTRTPSATTSIVSKVGNGKMSLWLEGKQILMDFEPAEFNIVKSAALASTNTGTGTYNLSWNSWVDEDNYSFAVPVYDETNQIVFGNAIYNAASYQPDGGVATVYSFTDYIVDEDNAVYTQYVLNPTTNSSIFCGHLIYLAKTDTEGKYYALRATKGWGYCIGVAPVSGTETTNNICASVAYPDSSKSYTGPMNIIVKVESGKVTVWIDGTVILKEQVFDGDVTGAAVGLCHLGAAPTVQVTSWTDNDNYGRLGDINGDLDIDVRDLVAMKKLAMNYPGYNAFNEHVKAFNDDGIITYVEFSKMRRYILGQISLITNSSNVVYGTDEIDAGSIE